MANLGVIDDVFKAQQDNRLLAQVGREGWQVCAI
jgi:hypothetical protein